MADQLQPIERDWIYDLESYPNLFLCTLTHAVSGQRYIFEMSTWWNDSVLFIATLQALKEINARQVGFNNENYDYPMVHYAIQLFNEFGYIDPGLMNRKSNELIHASKENKFANMIWADNRFLPQLDLLKIHHFDNVAKMTSLKAIEFNRHSASVEDLPFPPNTVLDFWQKEQVIKYNCHDVDETKGFYIDSLPLIQFRDAMTAKYGKDFTNFNDTKIGKEFFIMRLEQRQPGICYQRGPNGREPRQTFRSSIPVAPLIFPYVRFREPEFQRVLQYLMGVTLYNTKGDEAFKGLSSTVRGFTFHFGTGGIHGSLSKQAIHADQDHEIIDIDVKSYYPNLAIKNGVYPEHLGPLFCEIYAELYHERTLYPKKSNESAMLKLANNGVYGDSNNVYSVFYDPAYTMTITINGQLLICMLAEWLLGHPGIEPIQANTDGMTVRVHRDAKNYFEGCCKAWEATTALELEYANYQSMFIRDVNNYLAVGTDGKTTKRKGAYQWYTGEPNNVALSLAWHQDWSSLIVPKAAQAVLVDKRDLVEFVQTHPDPFDFMIRLRATGETRLQLSDGTPLLRTIRYHIATDGPGLVKVMPELKRKPGSGERHIRAEVGWSVNICNKAVDFDWNRLNRAYYVEEAKKLIAGMV